MRGITLREASDALEVGEAEAVAAPDPVRPSGPVDWDDVFETGIYDRHGRLIGHVKEIGRDRMKHLSWRPGMPWHTKARSEHLADLVIKAVEVDE